VVAGDVQPDEVLHWRKQHYCPIPLMEPDFARTAAHKNQLKQQNVVWIFEDPRVAQPRRNQLPCA
jgi:hypothetical protein